MRPVRPAGCCSARDPDHIELLLRTTRRRLGGRVQSAVLPCRPGPPSRLALHRGRAQACHMGPPNPPAPGESAAGAAPCGGRRPRFPRGVPCAASRRHRDRHFSSARPRPAVCRPPTDRAAQRPPNAPSAITALVRSQPADSTDAERRAAPTRLLHPRQSIVEELGLTRIRPLTRQSLRRALFEYGKFVLSTSPPLERHRPGPSHSSIRARPGRGTTRQVLRRVRTARACGSMNAQPGKPCSLCIAFIKAQV
jgi:hypothetical protein